MTPQEIADAIKALTAVELSELRRLLGWDDGPGGEAVGVREPRKPAPEGWPIPAPLREDYWESAE